MGEDLIFLVLYVTLMSQDNCTGGVKYGSGRNFPEARSRDIDTCCQGILISHLRIGLRPVLFSL